MRCLAGLLALSACNQLLGIDPTQPIDIPDAPDGDNDTVADELDNCRDVPNPSQSDVDKDGFGDICDNCPLIANALQTNLGDPDAVGDVCDPNPRSDGDCLLLFDSFANPAELTAHWQVAPAQYASSVTANPGVVSIAATPTRVLVFSKEITAGAVAVQAAASKAVAAGQAGVAIATAEDVKNGFRCWLAIDITNQFALWAQIDSIPASNPLSGPPIAPDLVLRLALPNNPTQGDVLQCRADFGVAVGSTQKSEPFPAPSGTAIGVFSMLETLDLHAIAIYGTAPCPPPIVR